MRELQVGGSLASQNRYYIKRKADVELYDALTNQELCYVFNSRQMGKSSLLLHVKNQLAEQGTHCCFIDLSRIGSVDITNEQWFAGIISELWRGFNLPAGKAMLDWWMSLEHLSPAHKFDQFFTELLSHYDDNSHFVIFFDEVDSTLSLPFNADDFFAIIRGLFNYRAENINFKRITFALFGVATPVDLVQDPTRSPFNIGRAIKLEGFTRDEAQEFANVFSDYPNIQADLISEIIHWTGGQPFLTQKICRLVLDNIASHPNQPASIIVANTVQDAVLNNWESQDNPEHIRSIRDRATLDDAHNAQILNDYREVLTAPEQQVVITQLTNSNRLYLTGLIAIKGEVARPRTLIYKSIFNLPWVDKQLANIRPFNDKIKLWQQSGCIDSQWLLSETELNFAKQWAQKKQLSDLDHRFLSASETQVSEQVKAWNYKLEQEIEQRKTAEKKLKKMVKAYELAKQEAEHANQAKTDFLTRVSHEVRTHLNSITGLGYIAQQQETNQEKRGNIKKITRTAKSMLHIMNDMVDINHIEHGQMEIHRETFFVDDIIDRVLDTMGYPVIDKGLTFEFTMPPQPINAIVSDANRLEQLLSNMLVGALKRTSQGRLALDIAQEQKTSTTTQLIFSVSDTGVAFPFERLTHQQLEKAITKHQLDISFKLAFQLSSLLGGELSIEQNADCTGSKISFRCNFKTTEHTWLTEKLNKPMLIDKELIQRANQHFLSQVGYSLVSVDLNDLTRDYEPTVMLVNKDSLYEQQSLLSFLQHYPDLTLLPVLPIGHQIPHWFAELGLNKHIEFPCTAKRFYEELLAILEQPKQAVPQFSARQSDIKVLVAEDDEINQQIIKELLASMGITSHVCSNGQEVIQEALSSAYDLILMDIEMPVLDGVSAVKQIRALGEQDDYTSLSTIPIIAMTAHALLSDKKNFIGAGMNDYLSKPIEPHQLINTLNEWLPEKHVQIQTEYNAENQVQLDHVNTNAGIMRCGNNGKLYKQLLVQFANTYGAGLNANFDNLSAILHALKGSAANLGIEQLTPLILKAETELSSMTKLTDERLVAISNFLVLVSNEIKQHIVQVQSHLSSEIAEQNVQSQTANAETKSQATNSVQTVRILLQQLLTELETDHAKALETAEQLPLDFDETRVIYDALQSFDIDLTERLIKQWIQNCAN